MEVVDDFNFASNNNCRLSDKTFLNELRKKTPEELKNEEEELRTYLEKLKKENFLLQTEVEASKAVLQNKLLEFKETEFKLNSLYEKIWSNREKFCDEADKFTEKYGPLTDWWKEQMDFINELESMKQKKEEERKNEEEIKSLQKEVDKLKEAFNNSKGRQIMTEVEIHSVMNPDFERNEENLPEEITSTLPSEKPDLQSCSQETAIQSHLEEIEMSFIQDSEVAASSKEMITQPHLKENDKIKEVQIDETEDETEDEIEIYKENKIDPPDNELFSIMDINKVRMANRRRKIFNSIGGKFAKV